MPTETAYEAGWHQGSVLQATLEAVGIVRAADVGEKKESRHQNDVWVVATQDCSLARTRRSQNGPCIELRQVHDSEPPTHWGIHSRKFLLDDTRMHYIVDDKPAAFVSPKLLCDAEVCRHLYDLSDRRVLALKTWLGNRYDRPAVPEDLVPLAKAIASAVGSQTQRPVDQVIRDVYIEFGGTQDARTFSLYAVTTDGADPESAREWLAVGALEVPKELGILKEIEVGTSSEVSLNLIETAYCADLSQLTWEGSEGPEGAF